jgi:hypothetical protein
VRELDRTHPTTIGVGNHTHIPWVFDHDGLKQIARDARNNREEQSQT